MYLKIRPYFKFNFEILETGCTVLKPEVLFKNDNVYLKNYAFECLKPG